MIDQIAQPPIAPAITQPVNFAAGRSRSTVLPLQFPIVLDGVEVDSVTVSRLTGQQFADLPEGASGNDIYGLMCSLPVSVVMGLDAVDTAAVLQVARDFLPQDMLTAAELTGESGTSTPPSSPES